MYPAGLCLCSMCDSVCLYLMNYESLLHENVMFETMSIVVAVDLSEELAKLTTV